MNVLAVDTSGQAAGVALLKDGKLTYEALSINRLTHSANLMPMVEEGFFRSGLTLSEIDLIACVVGPGSFTGVRIGVSAVKALAHVKNIRCVGINALEALCDLPFDGILCPIRDARAGQVYGAAFQKGERVMQDAALKLDAYLEQIAPLGERFLFVGDGVMAYQAQIASALYEKALFAPENLNNIRPSAEARLALARRDESVDYLTLAPLYLRAPQAERERALREAMHAGN